MGNLFVAHIEVLLQHSVDLPTLHFDTILVLQDPADLIGAANVVGLQDHLLDDLPDGGASVTLPYVGLSHLLQNMSVGLHSSDNLANSSRGNTVLFGNDLLLISNHNGLVSDVKDVAVGQLRLILDRLSQLRWCHFHPVGRIHVHILQSRVRVPALESLR